MLKKDIEPILNDIDSMQRDLDNLKRAFQSITMDPDDSSRLNHDQALGVAGVAINTLSYYVVKLADIATKASDAAARMQQVSIELRDKHIT